MSSVRRSQNAFHCPMERRLGQKHDCNLRCWPRWLWPATCSSKSIMDFAILLVDDEPVCLGNVADYFRQKGLKVTTARELEEAEALIIKFQYSLVIADLSLTQINADEGLRLIDHIQDRSPQTKVILLSGRISPQVRAEALRRGAQAVLDKPQSLRDLGDLAEQLLEVPNGLPA